MEKLLKLKEVAEILNMNENHIYKMTYRGDIPFKKFGRALRFKESELLT